jgi:hypothetical protein
MKKPFLETTWSKVEAGDTVLMPWEPLDTIVKVEVKRCAAKEVGDKRVVVCIFRREALQYGQRFDPEETVYVQDRL